MGKLGYQNSEIPEPTNIQFDTDDYVGGVIPHTKNQSDRRTGGIPANRLNITLAWSLVFGRPFVKRFAYAIGPSSCLPCPVCTVCNVGVLWPNGWTDQDETWHAGRPRPWLHCVRWGPSSPSPKGEETESPIFGPYLLWTNCWIDQDATWYGRRTRPREPRRLCVRWGPSSPSQKGVLSNFWPMSIMAKRLGGSRWHLA